MAGIASILVPVAQPSSFPRSERPGTSRLGINGLSLVLASFPSDAVAAFCLVPASELSGALGAVVVSPAFATDALRSSRRMVSGADACGIEARAAARGPSTDTDRSASWHEAQ